MKTRARNRPSAEEIWEEFRGVVFATFMRFGHDRDLAEDLTQDVFLRISSSMGRYRAEGLAGYVLEITRNTHYEHLRRKQAKKRSAQEVSLDTEDPIAEGRGTERDSRDADIRLAVDRAACRLPPLPRRAFYHCLVWGRSRAEAADMLGVSENQVREALRKARKILRKEL